MKQHFLTAALMAATVTVTPFVQANPAQALTFNFGRSGPKRVESSIQFGPIDGITATATGHLADGRSRNVFQNRAGLGVTPSLSRERNQIDGLGINETLNITFSETVNLIAATFRNVQGNDDFRLLVDGGVFLPSEDIPGNDVPFLFSPQPSGTVFGFTVAGRNDDYLLSSLEVTPVPTPVAVLPGLLSMGLAAIRKKKEYSGPTQEA